MRLVFIILSVLIASCSKVESFERNKYWEEPYIMGDGTLCVIIHGGSHSAIVGVSCNYKED